MFSFSSSDIALKQGTNINNVYNNVSSLNVFTSLPDTVISIKIGKNLNLLSYNIAGGMANSDDPDQIAP